jgi:Fic family protein
MIAYKSFVPAPLPPSPPLAMDNESAGLLVAASRQLAVLGSLASRIPNVNLFVAMYIRKEALMSSQIEGTQATLEDVLDPSLDENANRDVAEVISYIKATEYAIARQKELPLCNRLIRETHAVLMAGARGGEKNPGEFRTSQNWIGGRGSTLRTARYIPPTPADMYDAMSDLEKYIHAEDQLDVLLRAALIHYQFETIHPFLDGNGRIGRLLITLFLLDKGVLTAPALYISYYLKKNRLEYYDRMTAVRERGDYERWIKFFLRAVEESARDANETIDKLLVLREKTLAEVKAMGRAAKTGIALLQYLEANPIIEIRKTAAAMGLSFTTVATAVGRFCDRGILVQASGERRYRTFAYEPYLALLRAGT